MLAGDWLRVISCSHNSCRFVPCSPWKIYSDRVVSCYAHIAAILVNPCFFFRAEFRADSRRVPPINKTSDRVVSDRRVGPSCPTVSCTVLRAQPVICYSQGKTELKLKLKLETHSMRIFGWQFKGGQGGAYEDIWVAV